MAKRRAVMTAQLDRQMTLSDLSVDDVNLLIAGLGKLPLEVAADLWLRVKAQGEAQLKPPETPESAGLTE